MDKFSQIKNSVDIVRVAEMYGMKVVKKKSKCPLHSDNNPSISFKNNKFKCFQCENGGSSIDLVIAITGVSFIDAAKSINDSFGLNVDFNGKIDIKIIEGIKKAAEERRIKEETIKMKNKENHLYFKEIIHKHYELRKQEPSDEFWDNLKILRRLEDDYFGR